jgi:uncharacterized membrane protein
VWALEGAALVWMGARLRDDRLGIAGFLVFLLVIVRLAVSDSFLYVETSAYDLLLNARFLAFAVSAAALWAAAKWAGPRGLALAAYVSGHAVMLWGLGLEAVGWAARTAAPESFRNVATTSISVLAAFYAVLLVAGGSVWQSAITRVLGIGLIGLVVVKLYLYDVWLLGEFYRMAAFAILGVLLLAMSYLYSRFRERISQAIRLPRR